MCVHIGTSQHVLQNSVRTSLSSPVLDSSRSVHSIVGEGDNVCYSDLLPYLCPLVLLV